jgi:GT2 family glycosyltransferase
MNFKVVILSARADNLVGCIQSVLQNEPGLTPREIVVVDDGARASAGSQLPEVQWLTGIKPFVFSRNANLGIRAAGTDVILLNDDARLVTPHGFSDLAHEVGRHPYIGVCSAGIQGIVGNRNQQAGGPSGFRREEQYLAFVCVYIPRSVYNAVGPLDERFSGYGFEDNDYCIRVRAGGLILGVWSGCLVDHSACPSTFRSRPDLAVLFEQNRRRFINKWKRKGSLLRAQ